MLRQDVNNSLLSKSHRVAGDIAFCCIESRIQHSLGHFSFCFAVKNIDPINILLPCPGSRLLPSLRYIPRGGTAECVYLDSDTRSQIALQKHCTLLKVHTFSESFSKFSASKEQSQNKLA